jgi:hypothetical protein
VTPQEENPSGRYYTRSYSQRLFSRYFDLNKVYRRIIKKNYQASLNKNLAILEDIRTLFIDNSRSIIMSNESWVRNSYQALDMYRIQGFPHDMHDKHDKWLPKFQGIMQSLICKW